MNASVQLSNSKQEAWPPQGWKPRLQDISAFMGAQVRMLRLDEIDPVVSGNKWYKLRYSIEQAKAAAHKTIVTFGGAFSNHLIATAAAAHKAGLAAHGIVRTEPENIANATLSACAEYGMQLHFVSRSNYRRKAEPFFAEEIIPELGAHYLIPEGGADLPGRIGAGEIAAFFPATSSHIALPIGTGTTLAGICLANPQLNYLGYCATAKCVEQEASIGAWTGNASASMQIFADNSFGGFGRWNDELLHFIRDFYHHTGIMLDVVYTGKMMHRLRARIQHGLLPPDADIICIHTGGLQGNPAGLFGP